MKVELKQVTAPLRAPFVTASGSIDQRDLLLLCLDGGDGNIGFGEAAPLESYDGVRIDDCRAALEDCRGVLSDSDGRARAALVSECSRLAVLPQAIAAIDLALWDLEAKRAGRPVWSLLGGGPEPIEVNYTIAASDRAGAAAEAWTARQARYGTIKLKVGSGDDAGRVAAVRAAAGPDMKIRLDANAAWTVPEAHAALRTLAPAGIELCEEPVSGAAEIGELSGLTDVPLAMDESGALLGALDTRACTAVCLKISRYGGISGVLDVARRARSVGYELYLASTLDGPLGIAAALHAAAAIGPDRACGLATLGLFAGAADSLPPRDGRIAIPTAPGLGEGLVGWYGR